MVEFIREQRQTPVAGRYDVIVVGGGPAGVGAALALEQGQTLRALDGKFVAAAMEKQGARLK